MAQPPDDEQPDQPYRLIRALKRPEREPPRYFAGEEPQPNLFQRQAKRVGQFIGGSMKQAVEDASTQARALRGAAENIVPPLKILNAMTDASPRAQAEATQGPIGGGGSRYQGTTLGAALLGLVGPGGKPVPKVTRSPTTGVWTETATGRALSPEETVSRLLAQDPRTRSVEDVLSLTPPASAPVQRGPGSKPPLPSGQKELPGMQTSSQQRLAQAEQNLEQLRHGPGDLGQGFVSRSSTTPRMFEHNIDTRGRDYFHVRDVEETDPIGVYGTQRGQYERNISPNQTPDYASGLSQEMRQRGMGDEYNQAMDRLERLEGARQEAQQARAVLAGDERLRLGAQVRALRSEMPSDIAGRERQLQEMLNITRSKPIISEQGEVFRYNPGTTQYNVEPGGGRYSTYDVQGIDPSTRLQSALVEDALRELIPARREARMLDEFMAADPRNVDASQPAWVNRLIAPVEHGEARESARVFQQAGHPDAVQPPTTREVAEAFLKGARGNEALFQYGLEPPKGLYDMEEIAQYHAGKGNKRVVVDYEGGSSDEPYKIEVPKEHGRGELMRDRWGDYKTREYEPGDKMYDEYGELKMRATDKEIAGPTTSGEPLTKAFPKKAEGGELKRDEYGDVVYQKSRGGEQKRDERGRPKTKEIENPDYDEGVEGEYQLRIPGESHIEYSPEREHIHAMGGGGKGDAQLLYQIANSYAIRNNLNIGSEGLTLPNQYRLLGNQLSTFARHGVNPRDIGETLSGQRPRAYKHAGKYGTGFDIWNAEAGETEHRLLSHNVDPSRVQFNGEGFLLDGKRITVKEIDGLMRKGELNPEVGSDANKVGAKSWARLAVLNYLEKATPEMAQQLAKDWPKELGPLFATAAGAVPLARALRESEPETQ